MSGIFKGDKKYGKKVKIFGSTEKWGNIKYFDKIDKNKLERINMKVEKKIKKKMGRPLGPETEKITFALHKPLINDVRRYCKEHDIVMQRFVEKAIEQYMLLKINDEI